MSYQHTKMWIVDSNSGKLVENHAIREASMWIREGEAVAFPTETVYGLGANALDQKAVERIFKAKGRPGDNPLIVHVADLKSVDNLVESIPETARKLMKAFWPGPLTLVLPAASSVVSGVTAGLDTVAVRMPDHAVARALIAAAEVPVAAPSANRSGRPSPTTAQHVYDDLQGRIAGIVDGGAAGFGLESTVVDCSTEIPMILRPGGITHEQLQQVIETVEVDPALHVQTASESQAHEEAPRSPGMKYRHYAPDTPLILVEGDASFLQKLVQQEHERGKTVGVLMTEEMIGDLNADQTIVIGSSNHLADVAAQLYGKLREVDALSVDVCFCVTFNEEGIGAAIMNRLRKAAGGQAPLRPRLK